MLPFTVRAFAQAADSRWETVSYPSVDDIRLCARRVGSRTRDAFTASCDRNRPAFRGLDHEAAHDTSPAALEHGRSYRGGALGSVRFEAAGLIPALQDLGDTLRHVILGRPARRSCGRGR